MITTVINDNLNKNLTVIIEITEANSPLLAIATVASTNIIKGLSN